MNTHPIDISKAEILIVDDTPNNLRFLSKLLTEQGYEVRKATQGKMALNSVKSDPPDLILLDIIMPEMNGYDVCKHLKAMPETWGIPIIFLSALDEVFDKVKAFQVGGVDYITKPFHFEEVLVRVKTHLTLRYLTLDLEKKVQERTAELQQAQLQLVQHEKMSTLGQLVAGVAHEINNPVSFISGNIIHAQEYVKELFDLLKIYQKYVPNSTAELEEELQKIDLEYLKDDLPKLLLSMQEGADRIQRLSSSLRTFSRSDTTTKVPFDIHEGLDSTLMILKHRLKAQENQPLIEVIKNYGKLPLVDCYPGQLNQVFMNIIVNAIDALEEANDGRVAAETKANPNQITISTEVHPDTHCVMIRIRDNGQGMSNEVKERLFDYLFTTKPVGKGTGLGLSISRQIVESKHGGKLWCLSSIGQGTEFVIQLPWGFKTEF